MTRPGEGARRRARQGLPDVKPGKKSWVFGTKLQFFSSRKDAWLAATQNSDKVKAGKFYDKMAKLYIKKYGTEMGWFEDLEEDIDDPCEEDVDEAGAEDLEDLSEEEAERRSKFFKELRTVSKFVMPTLEVLTNYIQRGSGSGTATSITPSPRLTKANSASFSATL